MKNKKKILCFLFALLIFTSSAPISHAEEAENAEDQILAPYFMIQSEDATLDSFPLKATDVTTNINGMIAETTVIQTYTNEGEKPINARYVLPTSTDVTVHGMTLEIGNQIVRAQIKEKEEAKQEFEEAKSEGKSASLLEQQRPNVFTMDVANIMPGETARVELYYTELIHPTEGVYEFLFPTVVGPRYIAPSDSEKNGSKDWISTPYLSDGNTPPGEYHITVNLSTGVPITEISCKSHEISVTRDNDSTARVTLANPADYAGNRDFILKYKLTGEEVQSGLILTKGDKENFFMLTVQPPEHYTPEEIPPREYIFVLDVSGSMNGYPLDTGKDLIHDLVSGLRETDKFNLILFSGASSQMSPESLPATAENIQAALTLIDEQEGGGGTSLSPAVESALAIPKDDSFARSIVIITDGYIYNEHDVYDIINQNMDTANFFSFGIGTSVNRYLIEGIAGAGLGESFIVTDSADAADCAERFRSYIQAPLLTDITVSYEDFQIYDVATATPSTLFSQKPLVIFGKWKGDATGGITITGQSGTEAYIQEISVNEVPISTESDAICYLWARTKLDQLAGYGSTRNDSSVKDEITRLGLEYNMTTPYTSFIAVVDTVRNPEGNASDVNQPLPLPLKVSNLAIGGEYTAYSEPEMLVLITAMIGVLFLSFLRHRKRHTCH